MKYIKLFEWTNENDIKNDIDGILIELIDDKFYVEVKMDKYVVLKSSSTFEKTISFSNNNDRRYSCVTIIIKNKNRYNTNDIEDYVLTVIDYLKSKWGDKNSYGYEIPDRLEKGFYTFDGRWNAYTEFPKDLQLRQFIMCIRKN
jgi:hypothetical protein